MAGYLGSAEFAVSAMVAVLAHVGLLVLALN
jgi:hypothetical protein